MEAIYLPFPHAQLERDVMPCAVAHVPKFQDHSLVPIPYALYHAVNLGAKFDQPLDILVDFFLFNRFYTWLLHCVIKKIL